MTFQRRYHLSEAETAFLAARATMPRPQLHEEFCREFGRTDISVLALRDLCRRLGWALPFGPGKPAPNRGVRGQNPKFKPIGHENISKGGYVVVSVDEVNPRTGRWPRWVLKHKLLWEELHGPIPPGMVLKCRTEDRANPDPSNWTRVSPAMLPRLIGLATSGQRRPIPYESAPNELKPVLLTIAELEAAARASARRPNGDAA